MKLVKISVLTTPTTTNVESRFSVFNSHFLSRFLLEVFEKLLPRTLTWELFCAIHLICFVRFLKEYYSACFDCRWTKSCSFSKNEFHCCLGVCFQGFKKFEEILRFIYLECFLYGMYFFSERKYFYQSALLAISFVYFHADALIRIHAH